jgi:hypothetical protein
MKELNLFASAFHPSIELEQEHYHPPHQLHEGRLSPNFGPITNQKVNLMPNASYHVVSGEILGEPGAKIETIGHVRS